jgi:ABC-type lipoprotein release transport system permease subunit
LLYNLFFMDWLLLIAVSIGAVALIVFLVVRNNKDKNQLEKQLNSDYHKSKDSEDDIDIDEEKVK